MKKLLPVIFVGIAIVILISGIIPKRSTSLFPVASFGKLPVLEGGRYKPLDSVARTSMLLLRGKQKALDASQKPIPAIEWFMQLTLQPEGAAAYPVFLINHEDVKELIGAANMKQKYFSYAEIIPQAQKLQETVQSIPPEAARQDAAQKETLRLFNNLVLYQQLAFSFRGPILQSTVEDEYVTFMEALKSAAMRIQEDKNVASDDPAIAKISSYMRTYGSLSDAKSIKFVPVKPGSGNWLNLGESLLSSMQSGQLPLVTMLYGQLADAYSAGDVQKFRDVLKSLEEQYHSVNQQFPAGKVHAESITNLLQPFSLAMALYIWLFIGVLVSWLLMDDRLLRWIFWVAVLAFAVHTFGLFARMLIQGRPPVTNLYSSAIFVGWGSAALGLILERIFKNGLGSAVVSMIGFMTLIVASHLMASGDTMEMMRAVLDSNFWLATHVVTISLGYSSTYLAGFLAIMYFVLGILTPKLDSRMKQALIRMVYGIVCFSLLFSFVGTVLGGIWADQSWGRFWGWDPKENGALMIVIWNALVLHAKRGGVVRSTGFMNLAIFGNVVTTWSWFGTNMLGVGLHSYGFMSAAFVWLLLFCCLQIAIMVIGGSYPENKWKSAKD